MGHFVLAWGRKAIAYVDGGRVVINPVVASLIERCLLVYGLRVNMGIDEEVSAGGYTLTGFKVELTRSDVTEGYIVKSLEVCLGLLGVEATVETVGKLYEALPKSSRVREESEEEAGGAGEELEEIGLEQA